MYKKCFIGLLISLVTFSVNISATIVETQQIEDILPSVKNETLVLFNIAEVLTDSEISLGTSAWRNYVRAKAPRWDGNVENVHDLLTWYVACNVPHKAVEQATPLLIQNLQEQEIPAMAFTSRGRSEWYSSNIPNVDLLTEELLKNIDIDFTRSQIPFIFIQQEGSYYLEHYRNGILYCNHMEKGSFLKQLLEDSGYRPDKVIFIDDKRDSLETVDEAMEQLGVPFEGFWYTRTKAEHRNFNPMIAHVQLQQLFFEKELITDQEAQEIINAQYPDADQDQFFFALLNKIFK